jgi:hypothetical protein
MEQLKKWITQLPDNQRLVFQLRDIEGMTYKEIGDTLDMPLSQVKINLFRARQQVRAYLLKINCMNNISQLIEKYFQGETTLEEEKTAQNLLPARRYRAGMEDLSTPIQLFGG